MEPNALAFFGSSSVLRFDLVDRLINTMPPCGHDKSTCFSRKLVSSRGEENLFKESLSRRYNPNSLLT